MHTITSHQCKTARSLLKWNVLDLVNQVKSISSHRIDDFEKSAVTLLGWENDELVEIFKKNGIEFKSEGAALKNLAERRKESDIMQEPGKPPGTR